MYLRLERRRSDTVLVKLVRSPAVELVGASSTHDGKGSRGNRERETERDRDARKRVRKSKWVSHSRTKRQLGLPTKESRAGSWASPKTVEICWVLGFSKWRWPSRNTYHVGQVSRRPTPALVPCHTHNIYCMISVVIRLSSNKETGNVYGKKDQVNQSISKRKETTIQDT